MILSGSGSILGQSFMFGPKCISCEGSETPFESNTLFSYIVLSNEYLYLFSVSLSIWRVADVNTPLLAAVAAIDLASMRATDDICPFCSLLPSRLGKFLVECLIENALFAGVSPAPKHGPQNAVLSTAPVSRSFAAHPFLISSMYIGIEAGYTLSVNLPLPMLLFSSMSLTAQIFSNPPPAHPATIPCSTTNFPSIILSVSL